MNTKNLLIIGAVVIVGVLALWGFAGNKGYKYTQTGTMEESLQSDLTTLDSTDLEETNNDLKELDSTSSTF